MIPIFVQRPNQPQTRQHVASWFDELPKRIEGAPIVARVAALVGIDATRIIAMRRMKERGEPIILVVAL
jgi:hypothetical protein